MQKAKGDIVITMDADHSNRVSELNLLIEALNSGYDLAMGSRFATGGGTADMQWYRKLGNKFFVMLVNLFFRTNYSDLCYGYRAFKKEIIPKLKLESDGFGIETEISIRAAKINAKVIEIPSFEKARLYGKSNLRTFRDGRNILGRIFRELCLRR
jgi:glycosyltransferase involved in cell wall biosynthesis